MLPRPYDRRADRGTGRAPDRRLEPRARHEGDLVFSTAMPSTEYHALLRAKVDARSDLVCTTHPLTYRAGTWELLRIASTDVSPHDKVVVVRATIHGDEISGALSILNYFDELVDYAHQRGLKLILYPLGNPSGFDRRLRYNVDHHMGDGNNDFLRYVMDDGSIESDLGPGKPSTPWTIANDPALGIDLPEESRVMLELVQRDPLSQVVAAFDWHQDLVTDLPMCAYHYAYGDLARYDEIAARIAEVVPLLAGYDMAGGFGEQIDDQGRLVPLTDGVAVRSDANGFIVRHDGSFSDFYQHIGAAHSVATETTGATPMKQACLVNWIWFTGVVDLLTSA
jgi:hypothetical protein